MRTRTGVGIGVSLMAVKAALTAVALAAWTAIPQRRWLAPHWHIELGALAEWLAAFAAAGAAIVALYIATRDRHERTREREDAEMTQARLVRLTASPNTGSPIVTVDVRNHGSMPILDVELADAVWNEHPDARWGTNGLTRENLHYEMLRPDSENTTGFLVRYYVSFMHPTKEEALAEVAVERTVPARPDYLPIDLSKVEIRIRFSTANGVRWETPTRGTGTGEPIGSRLSESSCTAG